MNDIYLLTGGNMGNRLQNLQKASDLIESYAGTVLKKSSIYETAAWGNTQQDAFLNQVLCISSSLAAETLLQKLLAIELKLGRERIEKMGPRTIDIDILLYGNNVIRTPDLIVPHPRMELRRFVLTPLAEIAGDFVHPVLHKTISQLLQQCNDPLDVKQFS